MKKVYYISNMFPGKHDNYGIFVKKIYDFLEHSNEFKIEKITAIRGKSQNKFYNIIRYCFLLLDIFFHLIFSNRKFDIVYIQYVWKHAFFADRFTNFLLKRKKYIIINFHGEDLTRYSNYSNTEKNHFKNLCKFAKAIIVPSNYFKNFLIDSINEDFSSKIIVSPSGGVDSTIFFKENKRLNMNRIVYCSRFDKDKGWDDFIIAAKQLCEKTEDLYFTMIGYGKETVKVKELINSYCLNDRIELMVNPKQMDIANRYVGSNLFVFPTRLNESLGLVALEAMSCGLPVIASNIGAISEYVINGQTGYLYNPGDYNAIVILVNNYLEMTEEEKGRIHMNVKQMAERYKDLNVETTFINRLKQFIE